MNGLETESAEMGKQKEARTWNSARHRASPNFNHFSAGLWDQGVYPHFCDTRQSPLFHGWLVFGRPFLLYHRCGYFPQPCFSVVLNVTMLAT